MEHRKYTVKHSGYPNEVVQSTANTTKMSITREADNEKPDGTIVIPYVVGLGGAIRKTRTIFNIRVAFRSNTVKSTLMKVKDPLPTKQIASVVYEVPSIVG